MGVAAEPAEQELQLLVHHGVARDGQVKSFFFGFVREFAVEQQVADFEKIAMLGQLLDRIAAVQQDANVAVNIGDFGFAGRRGSEARIECEGSELLVKRRDINHIGPDRALADWQFDILRADYQVGRIRAHDLSPNSLEHYSVFFALQQEGLFLLHCEEAAKVSGPMQRFHDVSRPA